MREVRIVGQQKAYELPFWPPEYSDTDIGNWLVLAWHKCHGHPEIKLPDKLGDEWAAKLAEIDPVRESASITLAPLESALRKAIVDNDTAAAGRMVRAYIIEKCALRAIAPVVRTGIKVRKPMDQERRNRSRKAAADVDGWQISAANFWKKPQHRNKSASDIARLIDPNRWNTIRRKIHKP